MGPPTQGKRPTAEDPSDEPSHPANGSAPGGVGGATSGRIRSEVARCSRPVRSPIAAAAAALLILAPTLLYPYGRDQSVFAYVGTLIARGGMPYRDAWELKPPGVYLLYGLLARLAPEAARLMVTVRVMDVLLAAVTGIQLAALARRLPSPEAGGAAAAWYAALYFHGGYWSLAQAEAWANPLLLGAALLCLRALERKEPALPEIGAAGALAGGVLLLKFTAVLPLLPFVLLVLWRRRGHRAGSVAVVAAFLVGAALPCLAAVVWLRHGGAWDAYLDVQRGFVAPYVRMSASEPGKWLANLFGYTFGWLRPLWAPALLAGAACWAPVHSPGKRFAGAVLLFGLAAVWMQGKYFLYHWETALPWLALLTSVGTAGLLARLGLPRRAVPVVGVLSAFLWTGAMYGGTYRDACLYAVGRLPRDEWLARFGRPGKHGGSSFLADMWAADYVRSHSLPGEPVLVWGFEPAVYLFSQRFPPTRFFFNVPVGVTYTPAAWRRDFLADLRRRPPVLLLVAHHDAIPWATGRPDDSASQLRTWPELNAWVQRRYRRETRIEDLEVYRYTGEMHRRGAENAEKTGE